VRSDEALAIGDRLEKGSLAFGRHGRVLVAAFLGVHQQHERGAITFVDGGDLVSAHFRRHDRRRCLWGLDGIGAGAGQ